MIENASGPVFEFTMRIWIRKRNTKTYLYAWILIKQIRIHDIEIFEDPIFLPKASAATKI